MWSVVLKILSILGIILLCLLAIVLTAALLVLLCPTVYRGKGTARPGEYRAWFRFRWLFGLVRGSYEYPEDGRLRIKVLWKTVYDSGGKSTARALTEQSPPEPQTGNESCEEQSPEPQTEGENHTDHSPRPQAGNGSYGGQSPEPQPEGENRGESRTMNESREEQSTEPQPEGEGHADRSPEQQPTAADSQEQSSALKEQLRFWLGLVRDEDNQELVKYGLERLGRILKSIRPRYLRAEAVAGLGEPDLTGYAYGVYWAVKPFLGKKCRVQVTPDFERRILEGEAVMGGRIMAAVILYHVCGVLLDRRLRQLLDQLKNR